MNDLRKESELLDKRKVVIIEAIVTYLLTVIALEDSESRHVIDDINSILLAIDDKEDSIEDKDLHRIINCLGLSKDRFGCRMII